MLSVLELDMSLNQARFTSRSSGKKMANFHTVKPKEHKREHEMQIKIGLTVQ